MNSKKNQKSQKSPTVSRERFDNAIADIYRERNRVSFLEMTTVPRERFDRAISDIRRLRAQLNEAYAAGASEVLNSDVFNEYVPTERRQHLRPSRFARRAIRRTRTKA
jgi:hypothetical protein